MPLLTLISLSLLGMVLVSAGNQQNATTPDKDVRYTLQVVGPDPLPFQAVRLRLAVRNTATTDYGPVRELSGSGIGFRCENPTIKPRGELRVWHSFDTAFHYKQERGSGIPWQYASQQHAVILRPGEQYSVSWAHCGDFPTAQASYPEQPQFVDLKPLFPVAGTHYADYKTPGSLLLQRKSPGSDSVRLSIAITVKRPQGVDKLFSDHVQRDHKLASLLLWPLNVPEAVQLPRLRQLIQEYPTSSYTPYARFALARYYYARKASKAEREKGIQILRELLEPVRPDFPFEPYAIAALLEMDPTSHAKYVPIMDREYSDAVEWLGELRWGDKNRLDRDFGNDGPPPRMTWPQYRKRIPVDRWAKPVEKK